ncbi:UNVERIFIED_CONTAM: porin [Methylobacteriaceae bacterium AG10]|nr:porin [Methylobacteriaceae bacterium AG10]
MKLVIGILLGSSAGLAAAATGQAADLSHRNAASIEYVRTCSAYGGGFFYIPGTETCLQISGRARYEAGYMAPGSRQVPGAGDTFQSRGQLRINFDARTETANGTLRAFLRADLADRSGPFLASGTQQRIANAFPGVGQDTFGRVQNFVVADKAFVQFAGLTAGRASSFFDFYAHDFEIVGATLGSNVPSTNVLAYTATLNEDVSLTLAIEDPIFRKNPLYAQTGSPSQGIGTAAVSAQFTTAPTPIIVSRDAAGAVTGVTQIDAVQRSRMPDFVSALRYDAAWGSAQISAAMKDINVGGPLGATFLDASAASRIPTGAFVGAQTTYGWALQGGLQVNTPFIAPGDSFYLQGAYGEGAAIYTGYTAFSGTYTNQSAPFAGGLFSQWLADAVVSPTTGRIELSNSFTVVGSYLHYWAPEWRSAFFGSYGEMRFPSHLRPELSSIGVASGALQNGTTTYPTANLITAAPGTLGFSLNSVLRDTYQVVTGASLIWSPVKDLDIGAEAVYSKVGLLSGRALRADRSAPAGANIFTVTQQDTFQARFRVQRDF